LRGAFSAASPTVGKETGFLNRTFTILSSSIRSLRTNESRDVTDVAQSTTTTVQYDFAEGSMRSRTKFMSGVCVLALASTFTAEAALLGPTDTTGAGGSEVTINFVNSSNESISLDTGSRISEVGIGDSFALTQPVLDFINTAGLANVRFSMVGGYQASSSDYRFLSTASGASMGPLANGVRGTWLSTLQAFLTGPNGLNSSNAGDTNGAVNATYGPFAAGTTNRNYLAGTGTDFMADWGTAGTCIAVACNLSNLGAITANLFLINFVGTNATTGATGDEAPFAVASLDLASETLSVSAVPLPPALWLAATAFGLVGARARRRTQAA
jgi:hypothetical protein